MTRRHWHGCGPRGRVEFNIPEGLFAMRGGPDWGGDWGPFHFDFGDKPSGWGRGRRGRKRMFESGEVRLVLLKLIADEPRHGYDLIRAIEDLTGGEYAPSPGVVYPTLTLLQDMGLIEEGRSWLWTEDGRILFKAEASAWTPDAVQLQQVWVEPELRGQGYGTRGLSDLCRLLLETTPAVCLFVRPENAAAIALYDGVGMRQTITYRSLIFA